jgi:hypothetical protein
LDGDQVAEPGRPYWPDFGRTTVLNADAHLRINE